MAVENFVEVVVVLVRIVHHRSNHQLLEVVNEVEVLVLEILHLQEAQVQQAMGSLHMIIRQELGERNLESMEVFYTKVPQYTKITAT